MTDKNLESLLSEYEEKRRKANMEVEENISKLYTQFPILENIDDEINKYSINKTKSILNGKSDTKNFDIEIENLKLKKEKFIKDNKIDVNLFKPNYVNKC